VRESYAGYARTSNSCGGGTQPDAAPAQAVSSGCGCGSSSPTQTEAAAAALSISINGCCSDTSSNSTCCTGEKTPTSHAAELDYTTGDLAGVPQEAADFTMGCGNPTALANLKAGQVVVDIGSGGGRDSFVAAARVGPTGQVIGVDMTPDMLERARATAARHNITNVEFRHGYAEDLPVDDASIDVILSNCVINLTEDKGRVFSEAFRVLKPGGRLEVSDILLEGGLALEYRMDSEGWSECVTGALPEKEYVDLIAQAGFQSVSVRRRPGSGEIGGTAIFSSIISAVKPGGKSSDRADAFFNQRPIAGGCCG